MRYNVLVTGTSSYGVGEGLLKSINESEYRNQLNLIGASNSKLTAYKNLVDSYYILPNANHPDYLKEVNKIIKDEQIHILIPGSEAEMLFYSQNKSKIESELHIDIWVNKNEIINIFENKLEAEKFFINFGIKTPKSYSEWEEVFPLIIKPVTGKSSEGIFIAKDKEQYYAAKNFYQVIGEQIIVQEFIEKEKEYTVSLINLGNRLEIISVERILNKGATQYAKIVHEPAIEDMARVLHSALGDELILNLQILKKNKEYYIFEINPRFSGSAPMRAKLGFNEFDIIFANKYLNKTHVYQLKEDCYCIRGYAELIYSDKF